MKWKDEKLIKSYATSKGMTASALIRQVVLEHIEDEFDRKAYDTAMAEHKKNPVTYSLDEVQSMLDV